MTNSVRGSAALALAFFFSIIVVQLIALDMQTCWTFGVDGFARNLLSSVAIYGNGIIPMLMHAFSFDLAVIGEENNFCCQGQTLDEVSYIQGIVPDGMGHRVNKYF